MHFKAVHTLLLGFVALWNINGVEQRLCASLKDDRIVFPEDNSESFESRIQYQSNSNSSSSSSTTELPVNSTTVPVDDLSHSENSNKTTTELPTVDNRILVDTLPVCQPGFQLRAGRCRKSA